MNTVERALRDHTTSSVTGAAEGRMTILAHFRELRRRLAIILVVIALGTVAGYFLYQPILAVLERPFCTVDPAYRFGGTADRCVLVFSGVLDGFTTRLKIAALAGAVITAPLWLYQVWAFVTPGLRKTERRYTIGFVVSSTLLFAAGACVAYETLAKGLSMLLSQGGGDVQAMLTVTNYLNFVTLTLIVFGLSFELPLLVIIANLAGVLPSATLRKTQRIAIFLIFVFAGIVVPSTDPFSMCAMAIPMVLLYEAAVGFATLHDRRTARRRADQSAVNDLDDDHAFPIEGAAPLLTLGSGPKDRR